MVYTVCQSFWSMKGLFYYICDKFQLNHTNNSAKRDLDKASKPRYTVKTLHSIFLYNSKILYNVNNLIVFAQMYQFHLNLNLLQQKFSLTSKYLGTNSVVVKRVDCTIVQNNKDTGSYSFISVITELCNKYHSISHYKNLNL